MANLYANRVKVVRALSIFLALYLILLVVLMSLYDSSSQSGIEKTQWYNVTYAVRAITCIATLYTSFRIFGSETDGSTGDLFAYAIHYSSFMLLSACALYYDPVISDVLTATSLNVLAQNVQRMGIAYLIMVMIYSVGYSISEVVG